MDLAHRIYEPYWKEEPTSEAIEEFYQKSKHHHKGRRNTSANRIKQEMIKESPSQDEDWSIMRGVVRDIVTSFIAYHDASQIPRPTLDFLRQIAYKKLPIKCKLQIANAISGTPQYKHHVSTDAEDPTVFNGWLWDNHVEYLKETARNRKKTKPKAKNKRPATDEEEAEDEISTQLEEEEVRPGERGPRVRHDGGPLPSFPSLLANTAHWNP
ncbi:hypothetical protein AA313_de0201126 [Arthrobotrys entomopaga]|nr:hypothetical protein AA313_de0201126 [Arthrobotrys entomopaga]